MSENFAKLKQGNCQNKKDLTQNINLYFIFYIYVAIESPDVTSFDPNFPLFRYNFRSFQVNKTSFTHNRPLMTILIEVDFLWRENISQMMAPTRETFEISIGKKVARVDVRCIFMHDHVKFILIMHGYA